MAKQRKVVVVVMVNDYPVRVVQLPADPAEHDTFTDHLLDEQRALQLAKFKQNDPIRWGHFETWQQAIDAYGSVVGYVHLYVVDLETVARS